MTRSLPMPLKWLALVMPAWTYMECGVLVTLRKPFVQSRLVAQLYDIFAKKSNVNLVFELAFTDLEVRCHAAVHMLLT